MESSCGPTYEEKFVEVDGLRFRFLRAGDGPPLILVHGLLGYSFSWRHAIPLLACEHELSSREVFALDMPGAGFSECPPAMDAHLAAAAARLMKFLDAVGIDRCDLVGSSYGGTTVLRLATLAPHRVRSLALVAPANPWSKIGRKRLVALGIPAIGGLFPKFARRTRFLHRHFISSMYGDRSRLSEETVRGYSLALARPFLIEHAVKITHSWHRDMLELEAELAKVRDIPALLIWGDKDRLVSFSSAEILAHNFRISKIVVLSGVGHLPYEEAPTEFCRPVLEFLAEHSPARPLSGK